METLIQKDATERPRSAILHQGTNMTTDTANVAEIAKALGKAQKRGILALSEQWGPSGEHQAMKRLWYRNDIPMLLDHKSRTDDCWQLRPIGLAVRAHLQGDTP